MRIEIRPGEGGDDAVLFARELHDAVVAYLRRHDSEFKLAATDRTMLVEADAPELAALAGTHRVQRIPPNDRAGRRHSSTATVAVLSDADRPSSSESLPDRELSIDWFSGSGAGGQYRNRHPLCCRLTHIPTGLTVVSTRHRSRGQNYRAAMDDLTARLALSASDDAHEADQMVRQTHVNPERSGKAWTWNDQRNEVVVHATGERVTMVAALRGRLPI